MDFFQIHIHSNVKFLSVAERAALYVLATKAQD